MEARRGTTAEAPSKTKKSAGAGRGRKVATGELAGAEVGYRSPVISDVRR